MWARSSRRTSAGRRGSSTSDRKSTRLNSSHLVISYAVFCLKKKKKIMLDYIVRGRGHCSAIHLGIHLCEYCIAPMHHYESGHLDDHTRPAASAGDDARHNYV